MNLELVSGGGKYYTIKEVCNQLDVPNTTMIDTVNRLFPGFMKHGVKTWLDESQVAEISKELKKAHNNRTDTRSVAFTDFELLERSRDLVFDLTSRVKQLSEENEIMKPKAELADMALRDESTHFSIRDAGKQLGLNQTDMFNIVRNNGLLTQKDIPSQKALTYELLTLRTNVVGKRNFKQAVMTMQNIDNFRKRYL